MQIKVIPHMPFVELSPELKEKIKQVMSSQYDATTRHLDLSKFYANEGKLLSPKYLHYFSCTYRAYVLQNSSGMIYSYR